MKDFEDLPLSKSSILKKNIISVDEFRAITENEHALQSQVERYLNAQNIDFIRIPDLLYAVLFGKRKDGKSTWMIKHRQTGKELTIQQKKFIAGYLKGLKDLLILMPLDDKYVVGRYVELKTGKGKLTGSQKKKHRNLPFVIARSFQKIEQIVSELLKRKMQNS